MAATAGPRPSPQQLETVSGRIARKLRTLGTHVGQQAAHAYRQVQKDDADQTKRVLDEIGIDWAGLSDEMQQEYVATFTAAGEAALRNLGIQSSPLFDALNPAAEKWAATRGTELVTMIDEVTRQGLSDLIGKAFTDGLSPAELSDEIRNAYAFSGDRADLIALTELGMAHINGTLEGWQQSGVVQGKEVILSDDHDEEDECDDAQGAGVVPLDDDFGGLGDPPFHPRCQCDLLPEVIEPDAGEEA